MTKADLQPLLKLARKQPVAFAFNPGKSDNEHYFNMDRRKKPAVLGKVAKTDGPGAKFSFGTVEIDGKLLNLTCEKALPAMAKKVKKFLKSLKISLNVQVLDTSGNVIDSDVEDLPDDEMDDDGNQNTDLSSLSQRLSDIEARLETVPTAPAEKIRPLLPKVEGYIQAGDADQADAALSKLEAVIGKLPSGKPEAQEKPAAAPTPPSNDKMALVQRLNELKTQIGQVNDGDQREKLMLVLKSGAAAFKAGDVNKASALLDRLEKALSTLGGKQASDQASETAAPTPASSPSEDKAAIVRKINALKDEIGLVERDDQRKRLMQELAKAVGQVKGGDLNSAENLLSGIETVLSKIKAAKAPSESTAEPAETSEQARQDAQQPEQSSEEADCIARMMALEPRHVEAASKGLVADVNALKLQWDRVQGAIGDGDIATAMQAMDRVEEMIDAGRTDGDTAFSAEIAAEVKPFAEARLRWSSARGTMTQELGKLQKEIKDVCSDDLELKEMVDEIDELSAYLVKLDEQLEVRLDRIVNAKEPGERDTLKGDAIVILDKYETELKNPFFDDVDTNNGFVSVSVAATAREALNDIGRVLRA
ncbi:hypothetical protein [Sulfitobacter sediminilitoris]|nr:hypothetical protein [Sulfitobacter sediminilitoris]